VLTPRVRSRSRLRSLLAALLAGCAMVGLVAACGDDGGSDDLSVTDSGLPDATDEEMIAAFDPLVEDLDVVFTRAALIDREGGGYERSPDGTHLALYVEPTDDYTTAQYVDGVAELTNILTPYVYDRFPGVETYDVCQEPLGAAGAGTEPPPVTQVEIDRETYETLDFPLSLETIAEQANRHEPGFFVYVDRDISRSQEWLEATGQA
jgi:hypothetical protein